MTFKEFFDIEPVQKNSLIVFVFVFFMCFLQLYLFKNNFENEKDLTKIFLTMSLSVCWVASEIPTYFLFIASRKDKYKEKGIDLFLLLDRIVIAFGFSLIFWMATLTYIGYELGFSLRTFIRVSLVWVILKSAFWFFSWLKYSMKDKKQKA